MEPKESVDLTEFEDDAPTMTCGGKAADGGECHNEVAWLATDAPHEHTHEEWLCKGHQWLLAKATSYISCKECGEDVEVRYVHV